MNIMELDTLIPQRMRAISHPLTPHAGKAAFLTIPYGHL